MINRLVSKAKRTFNDVIFPSGAGGMLLTKPVKPVIVLYHGINKKGRCPFNTRHTDVSNFEKQVQFLTKHYSVVTLSEFYNSEVKTSKPKCVITFDDGYKNNYDNAAPVLKKYNCKAVIFVTGFNQINYPILCADLVNIAEKLYPHNEIEIDGLLFEKANGRFFNKAHNKKLMEIVRFVKPEFDFQQKIFEAFAGKINYLQNKDNDEFWKLMTDDEIKNISSNNLISIGSHGYYHTALSSLQLNQVAEELKKSKSYLENLVQQPIDTLAYPFGLYSKQAGDLAHGMGFNYQLGTETYNTESDRQLPYLKNRAGIYDCDTAANQLLQPINTLP